MEQVKQPDKMEVMPVKRLMLSMGIPMVLSMVLQAVYNIVDSAFVSNMKENGEAALNALTLAFPLQMLMVAVGIGTGVGANALLSKSLGQGDRKRASRVAGNACFLALVITAVFVLFGIFGVRPYTNSQTSNPQIAEMTVDYLRICCVGSFGILFFSIYEKLLQATGNSLYSTIAQIAGAVINMVLDPVLIYGWLGCPVMGVRGAAVATVLGQVASFALALFFHLRVNRSISNRIFYWKPSGRTIRAIYAIGLPAIVAQALMSVMTYGLNLILGGISESMVTAYGLYYKVQQFVLFAAFGLRDAMTPIISFSHGKQNRSRIQEGIRWGMCFTLLVMLVGFLLLELLAAPFSAMFGLSGETSGLCISAMRIISTSFVFAGANIAFQGIFQALDGGLESLIVSLCRQAIFVFPFALAFAALAKANADVCWTVWLTFPIAEILSAGVACLLFRRIFRKRVSVLTE